MDQSAFFPPNPCLGQGKFNGLGNRRPRVCRIRSTVSPAPAAERPVAQPARFGYFCSHERSQRNPVFGIGGADFQRKFGRACSADPRPCADANRRDLPMGERVHRIAAASDVGWADLRSAQITTMGATSCLQPERGTGTRPGGLDRFQQVHPQQAHWPLMASMRNLKLVRTVPMHATFSALTRILL